jgi:hypothetical protein
MPGADDGGRGRARKIREAGRYAACVVTQTRMTCPQCGLPQVETMPTDACQYVLRCEGCETLLRPLEGDCCVFCSYADHACPPRQKAA